MVGFVFDTESVLDGMISPEEGPVFFLYEKTNFVRLLSYLWRLIPVNRGPSLFPYVDADYLDLYWILFVLLAAFPCR